MREIVVGTRQSALALVQTNQVIERLREISAAQGWDYTFRIHKIVTKGDRILDVTLSKVGGKGLFVKEIEQAMLDKTIDIAVHSMKDVPSALPEGLMIGAVPGRVDPRDCLITRDGRPFSELPQGARVGTSSLRRGSQLRARRPDLAIASIRGNIDTRIAKLESEGLDAIVLAAAGLERTGWSERITERLDAAFCVPAVGQGALGIECRADDEAVLGLLGKLNDPVTATAVAAERGFLRRLNGGCQIPIGAHAVSEAAAGGDPLTAGLRIEGIVGSPDGSRLLRASVAGFGRDADQLGVALAERLLTDGADRILAELGVE